LEIIVRLVSVKGYLDELPLDVKLKEDSVESLGVY